MRHHLSLDGPRRGRRRARIALAGRDHRHLGLAVAAMIVVVGSLGSLVGAAAIARESSGRAREAFDASAAQIASSVGLEMEHEVDLVDSTAAFVAEVPQLSQRAFQRFVGSAHALGRYPEILGIGHALVVPGGDLARFVARERAAGGRLAGSETPFTIVPGGARRSYCLAVDDVSRAGEAFPPGFDFCAGPLRQASRVARDTGTTQFAPTSKGRLHLISVLAPVYRGGSPAATVAARRARSLGWVGMAIRPDVLLRDVVAGRQRPNVGLELQGRGGVARYRTGAAPTGSAPVVLPVAPGWTLRVTGPVPSAAITANADAVTFLVIGLALSLALGALALSLALGRERALALLRVKTGQLRHQALHDPLTGLPNRNLVVSRAARLLLRSRREQRAPAALVVRLDSLKLVNDTLGREAGDQLIRSAAGRLEAHLCDVDTLGRVGDGQFALLLADTGSRAPEELAEQVLSLLRPPFELGPGITPVGATVSIGIASGDRDGAPELLHDAEIALDGAKAAGPNRYALFSPAMERCTRRRQALELALRGAFDAGEFSLAYQPVYRLDDLEVIGVEALLRWQTPELGSVSPSEFVPILEATDQIGAVGRWVLAQACSDAARWRQSIPALTVAVNVSGRQLDDAQLVHEVRDALVESGLPSTALTLEVTETLLMRDIDAGAQRLGELKALGIAIAIDDFGTGYSSLAYIQRLPVDALKIDRSFVTALHGEGDSRMLIHTVVELARHLGACTVAEGVESAAQLERLYAEGVDAVQGFLLAPPLSAAEFTATYLNPLPLAPSPACAPARDEDLARR